MDNRGLKKLLLDKYPPQKYPVLNRVFEIRYTKQETRWFRKYTHHYLSFNVRIEYGYHFDESDKSYHLQIRGDYGWIKIGWTYGEIHGYNMEHIIRYLTHSHPNLIL